LQRVGLCPDLLPNGSDANLKLPAKGGAANGGKSDKATRRTEEVDFDWTLRS
jgi:hypothetical protein